MHRLWIPVLCGLAACRLTPANDASTDPSPVKLNFPAGIAMDSGGRLLYVSNGNADLRYGGGTLLTIDTLRVECAIDAHKKRDASDPACAQFEKHTPTDIALVTNDKGIPTAGCIDDPLDPSVVDCVEDPFVLSNATVRVGNFAGTIRVRKRGATTRSLYLAVRGDPSITYADIDVAGLAEKDPDALGHIDTPGLVDCFDDVSRVLDRDGYDRATNTTTLPPRCDKSHLIQTYTCPGRAGCLEGDNDIPSEPFNLLFEEGTAKTGPYARLLVAHLQPGQVSLIDLLGAPVVADVSPPFFAADRGGRRGAFGIARRDGGDAPLYYLTSNLTAAVSTFRITDTPGGDSIVPSAVFAIGGAFASGADGREIVFEPGGQRAFMTQNAPPSVAVLDTRLDEAQTRGLPSNKVVDTIQVCQSPSHMALRQRVEAGPPGADPTLRTKLYVACFTANQIMVVDPDRPGVDETILLGRGPTELAFNFSGAETPAAEQLPEPRHRRLYVTNYAESTIGVIDLDPDSPTENRLVARIGMPFPPTF